MVRNRRHSPRVDRNPVINCNCALLSDVARHEVDKSEAERVIPFSHVKAGAVVRHELIDCKCEFHGSASKVGFKSWNCASLRKTPSGFPDAFCRAAMRAAR
jgi:hypothetical protein